MIDRTCLPIDGRAPIAHASGEVAGRRHCTGMEVRGIGPSLCPGTDQPEHAVPRRTEA